MKGCLPNAYEERYVIGEIEKEYKIQFEKALDENRNLTYRTLRENTIFKVIPMIAEEIRGKENGTTSKIKKLSRLVLSSRQVSNKYLAEDIQIILDLS